MKIITKNTLFNIFLAETGNRAKFVNIETLTICKPNKFSRLSSKTFEEVFKTTKIYKRSSLPVQINVSYTNSVNARREKDGQEENFVSSGLPYGSFVADSKILIEHKGERYVRVFQTNSVLGKNVIYEKANGEHLTEEEVKILKEEFLREKPEMVGSQNLSYEDSSKPTNYKLDNIIGLKIDGNEYKVVG